MVRVIWSEDAIGHVEEIRTYLKQFDPGAADQTAARLVSTGESLSSFPARRRQTREGFRELVSVRPYILRYLIEADTVFILRIRHAARLQYDPDLP